MSDMPPAVPAARPHDKIWPLGTICLAVITAVLFLSLATITPGMTTTVSASLSEEIYDDCHIADVWLRGSGGSNIFQWTMDENENETGNIITGVVMDEIIIEVHVDNALLAYDGEGDPLDAWVVDYVDIWMNITSPTAVTTSFNYSDAAEVNTLPIGMSGTLTEVQVVWQSLDYEFDEEGTYVVLVEFWMLVPNE